MTCNSNAGLLLRVAGLSLFVLLMPAIALAAGDGGSMLSIGSAAGVAVMGTARGVYTFFGHLKWSWAILLGYLASIGTHFMVNASLFT
jgi:Na+/H+ antiporter NhaD/arsenite permease-like protein